MIFRVFSQYRPTVICANVCSTIIAVFTNNKEHKLEWAAANIWLIVTILTFISMGSWIKGLTGMGLPLFAIPAVATLTSVEEAVVLLIIPGLGSNIWLVVSRREFRQQLVNHKAFLIAGFIGGVVGTLLLVEINDRWLKLVLAVWLALYLIQRVFGNRFQMAFQARGAAASVIGASAGIIQGATGVSSHIVAPYFHSGNIKPGAYAFLMATSFLTFSVAQLFTAVGSGLFTPDRVAIGLIALVPTLIFTQVGIAYSARISNDVFQKILFIVFLLMEIKLLWDIF
jgi:uncharacterized membrane protein YfcA